jgi:predicted house-cleaning noncanonical NTP pyrophosphatase (MazG superfamily)
MKYNKLIRDLIPQRMDAKGVKYTLHEATPDEYDAKLKEKLKEEVQEYLKDLNTEELADILEVIYALAESHGATIEDLEKIRLIKLEERGGFKKQLILDETN